MDEINNAIEDANLELKRFNEWEEGIFIK